MSGSGILSLVAKTVVNVPLEPVAFYHDDDNSLDRFKDEEQEGGGVGAVVNTYLFNQDSTLEMMMEELGDSAAITWGQLLYMLSLEKISSESGPSRYMTFIRDLEGVMCVVLCVWVEDKRAWWIGSKPVSGNRTRWHREGFKFLSSV